MANAIFTAFKEYKTEFESNNSSSAPPSTGTTTVSDTNNTENTKNPTYYVQIAASKKKMNVNAFKNVTNVVEKYYNGNYIYLTSMTTSVETVKKSFNNVKKHYKDAFIVAFLGDKRLTLKEAEALK